MIARRVAVSCKSQIRRIARDTKIVWKRSLARRQGDRYVDKLVRDKQEIVENILQDTEITCDHMTPELKLFLLTPNCPLYHAPFESESVKYGKRNVFVDPFWSIYWPGGQALTRFILDEWEKIFPSSEKEKIDVLDLGAGCGASAIAARLAGAQKVLANDIDEVACVAISMNAILNNVDIEVSHENLLCQLPEKPQRVVFVGDLLYDEEITEILLAWLEHAFKGGSRIYIGDPGRHCLTRELQTRLKLIRQYPLPENVQRENYGFDRANVWEFYAPLKKSR